jgi:hypothetical protein
MPQTRPAHLAESSGRRGIARPLLSAPGSARSHPDAPMPESCRTWSLTYAPLMRAMNCRHVPEANRSRTSDELTESRTTTVPGMAATSAQAPLATLYPDLRQVSRLSSSSVSDMPSLRIEDDRNRRVPCQKRNLRAHNVSQTAKQSDRSPTRAGPLNLNCPNPLKRWRQSNGPGMETSETPRVVGCLPSCLGASSGRSRSHPSSPSR